MANRRFEQFQLSLEKAIVTILGQVAIGATGAPTMSAANSKGITSVVRASAGRYTITLADRYQRLVGFDYTIILAAGAPGSTSCPELVVRADNSGAAAQTLVIEFLDGSGAAIELTSGVTLLLDIKLKNSGV